MIPEKEQDSTKSSIDITNSSFVTIEVEKENEKSYNVDKSRRSSTLSFFFPVSLTPKYHNFYITIPWSPQIYLTSRGAENIHIYLWILKDFCWTQSIVTLGLTMGSLALIWCCILFYHAFECRNYEDMYMLVALTLWLFGNFWWMKGELTTGDDDVDGAEAGLFFSTALGWILLYHLILRPFGFLTVDLPMKKQCEDVGLVPRFSYFKSWRQYEHAHIFFWCGKDWSWNYGIPYTWVFFVIPTFLLAVDFIYCTHKTQVCV